jgi:hypothetical protein
MSNETDKLEARGKQAGKSATQKTGKDLTTTAETGELQPGVRADYLVIEDPELQVRLMAQLMDTLHFPKDMPEEEKIDQVLAMLKSVRDVPRRNGLEKAQIAQLMAMQDAVMKAWARASHATSPELILKLTNLAARLTVDYDKVLSSMHRRASGEKRETTMYHHHTLSIEAKDPMLNITPQRGTDGAGASAKAIAHEDPVHRVDLSAEIRPKQPTSKEDQL